MAIATGVWGNSTKSCENKWDDYVKEHKSIWKYCNGVAMFGYGEFPKECDDSDVLMTQYTLDLQRKEFIDECSGHTDYPQFNHFNQGAPKSRDKRRQRKHHYISTLHIKVLTSQALLFTLLISITTAIVSRSI